MLSDLLFFFGVGLAFGLLGSAFIGFPRALARRLVTANLRLYRDGAGSWKMGIIPPPSKKRIRWLEALEGDVNRSPGLLWGIRGMGAFALLLASAFIAGGVARVIG